jgi:F-type H+-transporting ATPase subunit b
MGEALGDLGINLPGLIGQIISFVILLALLYMIGYKPIMRMMDERQRRIKEGMEKAEYADRRAAEAEQEFQKRVEEARKEGQALIAQASEMGERLKEEARQKAHEEAEALIARARSEIRMERDQAIEQLRREFADLTILAAEKVIKESLDKERHRKLIEEVLKESTTLKK